MLGLQALRQRLAGQPFEVLAVNFAESAARVRDHVGRLPVDLPVLLDPNQDAARAWRVRLLPVSFLVAPDGRPRYTVLGEFDWGSEEAVAAVRGLLR
jgi:hypothetical protein